MDLFRSTLQPVEKALADAKMDKGSIHDVVLVGGSTRIPKIQKMLQVSDGGGSIEKIVKCSRAIRCAGRSQGVVCIISKDID